VPATRPRSRRRLSSPPAVTLWDGRLAGQIGQEHMQSINRRHEAFARNLSHSVGAYLRIEFQAALVSGEHLTYGEFLQSVPARVSNSLLRKISDRSAAKQRLRPEAEHRLRARLLKCPFVVELIVPSLRVPLRVLAKPAPGGLLKLSRSTAQPVAGLVGVGRRSSVPPLLEWQLSPALVAALRPVPEVEPKSEPAKTPALPSSKLDLLMDVELDLTLRFGQRNMTLREIMELDAGSIVELGRQVQEPADLLLEGRLIARGEVVVVDGNYGLRVLEIVSLPDWR